MGEIAATALFAIAVAACWWLWWKVERFAKGGDMEGSALSQFLPVLLLVLTVFVARAAWDVLP